MEGKWLFIVNPIAGNGFAKTLADELQKRIDIYKIDAEIVHTRQPGHATEITKKYLQTGYDHFIAVGGDGTFNEMSKVLINKHNLTVGIIPAGTGNDFIQILGFPERFSEQDWDIFFNQKTIYIDVGSVNGIIFFNGMGLGFDAEVAAQNYDAPGKTKLGSKNKYVWHILKTLLFYKESQMTVKVNNSEDKVNCFINTVAIGRRFAGGFYLTPKAIANDGLLDVCFVKNLSLIQRTLILPKVPKGTHIYDPKVHYYQTDKLDLAFDKEMPFHVDGELNFASKFDIRLLPNALKIIYNPGGNHFLLDGKS
jgi:YegS/Rv2252/BmrU family lipid kinase